MKFILETLDGLTGTFESAEISEMAMQVNSPLWHGAPTPEGSPQKFVEYRRYERISETRNNVPVFKEI